MNESIKNAYRDEKIRRGLLKENEVILIADS